MKKKLVVTACVFLVIIVAVIVVFVYSRSKTDWVNAGSNYDPLNVMELESENETSGGNNTKVTFNIDTPTSGSFLFCGEDVSHLSGRELWRYRKDNIGFVFQNFALIDHCNVLENVSVPLEAMGMSRRKILKRADDMLEMVGIRDLKTKYPGQISGGQKQRVAIARALISNPKIILADEPTGALDAATGEKILDILKEINDMGTTVIIVTHDEMIAHKTKRLIILEDSGITGESSLN